MLKTCAKTGTAKKLASLDCEIASKTGTVGKSNSKQNLDAWNISYTKEQTCGIWLGELDNSPIDYAGGNQPTEIVKNYFSSVSDNSHFNKPSSIVEKTIDSEELNEEHRVVLANSYIPERYTQTELFSVFNLPNEISSKFTSIEKPIITSKVESGNAIIEFNAKEYITYEIFSENNLINKFSGKNGKQTLLIPLSSSKQKVTINNYYTLSPDIKESQEISFLKKEKRSSDKWYI